MPQTAQSSSIPVSRNAPPSLSNPAVAHCARAWERTRKRILSAAPDEGKDVDDWEDFAREKAEAAFRNALPPLCGEDNIRDFIACVAYALVNEIILPIVCTDYMEAAKVALSAVRAHRRQPNSSPAQ